jgi:hypothetical protein
MLIDRERWFTVECERCGCEFSALEDPDDPYLPDLCEDCELELAEEEDQE